MALSHLPRPLRHGDLEHGLRQIHCDRRRLHLGLLLPGCFRGARQLWHSMPFESREESISSLKLTAAGFSQSGGFSPTRFVVAFRAPQLSGHPLGGRE